MTSIDLFLCLLCISVFSDAFRSFGVGRLPVRRHEGALVLESSKGVIRDPESLWNEQVDYVDLNTMPSMTQENTRALPLFMLGSAFFPQGVTYLNIFEMRYRTMMFDIAKADDMFGYIHTDSATGQIACIGTLCKVVDRELLEDGRQYIALEGVSRFRVVRITKTLPYVMAEVELDVEDLPAANEQEVEALEKDTYNALKHYMRLMRSNKSTKDIVISQATKKHRWTNSQLEGMSNAQRRSAFSFSLANMIQMVQPRESQLLLQTQDVMKRLKVEREILTQATQLIEEQLLEMQAISSTQVDLIKANAYSDDFDLDILPPDMRETEKEEEIDEWDISNIQ